ncbi:P-loop containing nucleoside triphosphate hydrolase [Sesbania bispinosa]|nr:P-loop containing nucleoside triphosphate hydrolase [Sesbania bispinosa]
MGEVTYDTTGFLEKNRDLLHLDSITTSYPSCTCRLPQIFARSNMLTQLTSRWLVPYTSQVEQIPKAKCCNNNSSLLFNVYAGFSIMLLMGQLFQLIQRLESTTPHFIRCIKPNNLQSPESYEQGLVLQQLDAVGSWKWFEYQDQASNKNVPTKSLPRRIPLSVSVAILHQFTILPEMYQVGYTKLFFRTGQMVCLKILEIVPFMEFYVCKVASGVIKLAVLPRSFGRNHYAAVMGDKTRKAMQLCFRDIELLLLYRSG